MPHTRHGGRNGSNAFERAGARVSRRQRASSAARESALSLVGEFRGCGVRKGAVVGQWSLFDLDGLGNRAGAPATSDSLDLRLSQKVLRREPRVLCGGPGRALRIL